MHGTELPAGKLAAAVELLLRAAVYVATGVATLVMLGVFGFAAVIAVGGTGGFTSDLPPEHPAWLGLALALGMWAVLQWGLVRLQRYFLAMLDQRFGGPHS
jgi:hypothetical protein